MTDALEKKGYTINTTDKAFRKIESKQIPIKEDNT